MKRVIFVIAVVLSMAMRATAQEEPITLQVGQRLPNLYYWDTNWIDYKQLTHFGNAPYYYTWSITETMYDDLFLGRPCITDVPMKVIGVAGIAIKKAMLDYVIDTTTRWPEYFYLYQVENDSLHFLDSANWDTATVHYKVKMPFGSTSPSYFGTIFNLYEVYFEEPKMVHDTFVVGGTTHNNIIHGYDEELFSNGMYGFNYTDHLSTIYGAAQHTYSYNLSAPLPYCYSYPPYYYKKYCRPYYYYTPQSLQFLWGAMLVGQDTSHFQKVEIPLWLPFFAIFDTNFDYEACMGVRIRELHVEEIDTNGSVTLAWNDSGVEEWQVEVMEQGEDSGTLYTSPINYMMLSGLDTGTWYVARVRTLCDTDLFGAWSDTVMFYVPGHSCVMPTGLHVVSLNSTSVSLAWDASMASSWKVEIGLNDLGMNNGQQYVVNNNSLTVTGLPYSDTWYWARVRVVCDTDFSSAWTDTIRFHLPLHQVEDTTDNGITPVEQYTYLMPNPAREEVAVMSSFRVKAVELYAADGKLLQRKEVNAVGTTLDLKGLPAGTYFVRVHTTAGVTTKRLVVE